MELIDEEVGLSVAKCIKALAKSCLESYPNKNALKTPLEEPNLQRSGELELFIEGCVEIV